MRIANCELWAAATAIMAGWSALGGCGLATSNLTNKSGPAGVEMPKVFDDREWAAALREIVKDRLVDYDHLMTHRESLDQFLGLIATVGPESTPDLFTTSSSKLAYYINAYNAGVLKAVVGEKAPPTMYPPGRPALDHRYDMSVDRKRVTLHDLRAAARTAAEGDPRVEFALCAAALGSPPLADQPWRADTLMRQLEEAARAAMDDRRLVAIDHVKQQLLIGLAINEQREEFLAYYAKLIRAPAPQMLNVLLLMAGSVRREWLNTAVGYPETVIPFDRALNKWTP